MWVEGKQFADAPESSAALTVVPVLVLMGPKVTFLLALLTGLTCIALLVFRIDVGDFVDSVDREESDDLEVVVVLSPIRFRFKGKSEIGARL